MEKMMVDIEIQKIEHLIVLYCLSEKGLKFRDVFKKAHNKVFGEDSEEIYNFEIHNKFATDVFKKDITIVIPESNLENICIMFSILNISYKIIE
jgi:hypothetical protein